MTPHSLHPGASAGSSAVHSTIGSLKEIVTIIAGLTITNSIVQLFSPGGAGSHPNLRMLDRTAVLLFGILVANVIRFYHGNMRHLDTTYIRPLVNSSGVPTSGGRRTALDFFVILFQSLVFAINSFLLRSPTDFFMIFTALLVVDVTWFLSVSQIAADRSTFDHQKRWTLNNTITVFGLLFAIACSGNLEPQAYLYILGTILILNTIIDFTVSWHFYFPEYHPTTPVDPPSAIS